MPHICYAAEDVAKIRNLLQPLLASAELNGKMRDLAAIEHVRTILDMGVPGAPISWDVDEGSAHDAA